VSAALKRKVTLVAERDGFGRGRHATSVAHGSAVDVAADDVGVVYDAKDFHVSVETQLGDALHLNAKMTEHALRTCSPAVRSLPLPLALRLSTPLLGCDDVDDSVGLDTRGRLTRKKKE